MKRKLILFMLLAVLSSSYSMLVTANDIIFDYDDSGNCILKRKTVVLNRTNSNNNNNQENEVPEEFFTGMEVQILPNPTKGILKINLIGKIPEGKIHFKLISTSGNVLNENYFYDSSYILDMTAYSSGIYILQLKQGEIIKEWKIIKE